MTNAAMPSRTTMKTTVITIDWPRSLFRFISACSIS